MPTDNRDLTELSGAELSAHINRTLAGVPTKAAKPKPTTAPERAEPMKVYAFSCPNCGQFAHFTHADLSRREPCPRCGATARVI